MDKFAVPLDDLVLDLTNPRLVEANDQSQALRALVELGPGYFRTLMNSIRDHGLDPGDAFYVLEDPTDTKAFVVVDGNRRLSALKVLNEPSLLRGIGLPENDIKLLSNAAVGYAPGTIQTVECVLFDDRESADDWIQRRHGRDLGGEGRLTWGPLEIDRFQRDHSNLDVIAFVERNTEVDSAHFADIKKAVENNSSTLNRFLASKPLRKLVGLTITTETDDSKVPYFTSSPDHALGVLEQIFRDIFDKKITSRSYNTAEEIEAYLEKLPDALRTAGRRSDKPARFRDAVIEREKPAATTKPMATKPPEKTTRAQRPRLHLAEKKHLFEQPQTEKGKRLVFEASRLNAQEFPLSAAYVLRAFLEQTIDTYMLEHDLPRAEGKVGRTIELQKRAETVINHLIKDGGDGQGLRGAGRVLTNTKDPASIQALNDYHHDRYQVPAPDALRAAWDACVPLFIAVYGAAS